MSWLQRMAIIIVLYLLIGAALGILRHGNSRGGLESFVALVLYPVMWPHYEYLRLEGRWDEQNREENARTSLLAEICPPDFHSLFYSHFLDGKALPSYRKIRDAAIASPPVPEDRRSGYVLFKLSEAAAETGNTDILNDTSALLNAPGAGAGHFMTAAAIAHGVFMRSQTTNAGNGEEERIRALRTMLTAYERALPHLTGADQPHVDLAMGTLYQEACRLLPEAGTAGMRDKAQAAYLRAAASGEVAASFPAAINAARLAENDAERKEILAQFLNSIDFAQENRREGPLTGGYWTVAVPTQRRGEATAGFIVGKSLLPALDPGMDKAMLTVTERDGWYRGIRQRWSDFMFLFSRTADDFPARPKCSRTSSRGCFRPTRT